GREVLGALMSGRPQLFEPTNQNIVALTYALHATALKKGEFMYRGSFSIEDKDGAIARWLDKAENLYCFGGDPDGKLHLLTEYAGRPEAIIDDPWYTRDFDTAWDDIYEGCLGLLNTLSPELTLDFSSCRERGELYDILAFRMLWEKGYGRNLDALYDILTGLPHLGRRFKILLPAEDAPCRGYAEIMAQVFEDAGAEVTSE
ncbi:MAG: barstar family protein, partial [Oscillospiraceae bacterium]|nr:barstar family protein [Oscillospiraceae bacterium]